MAKFPRADKDRAMVWQAHGRAGLLALAASPTFALMAWIAANDARPTELCSSGSGIPPIDGMSAMYLLMSLFHLSPWLKFASGRWRQAANRSPKETDDERCDRFAR